MLSLKKKELLAFTPEDKVAESVLLFGFPTLVFFNAQLCGICAASEASFYSSASIVKRFTPSLLLCGPRFCPPHEL